MWWIHFVNVREGKVKDKCWKNKVEGKKTIEVVDFNTSYRVNEHGARISGLLFKKNFLYTLFYLLVS